MVGRQPIACLRSGNYITSIRQFEGKKPSQRAQPACMLTHVASPSDFVLIRDASGERALREFDPKA
jgi:hypothetical protein